MEMTIDKAILLALAIEEDSGESLIVYRLGKDYGVGSNAPRLAEEILRIDDGRIFAILDKAA
jgi:hypothetical protein